MRAPVRGVAQAVRRRWTELVVIGSFATLASATVALAAPLSSRTMTVAADDRATAQLGFAFAPALDVTSRHASLTAVDHGDLDPRIAPEAARKLFAVTSGLLMALRTMLSELGTARPCAPRDAAGSLRAMALVREQRRAQAALGQERATYSAIAADAAGGPTGGTDRRLKHARGECDYSA